MYIDRSRHFSEPPVVRAVCGGVPVLAFGYTHIYTAPPELLRRDTLQAGNSAPQSPIPLRRSDAISGNLIGCDMTRLPRTSENDFLPQEGVHLIDGEPDTCWTSKTLPRSDMAPVWARVDFPALCSACRVVLRKRPRNPRRHFDNAWGPEDGAVEVGRGIPAVLLVETSADLFHWDTVFDGSTGDTPDREFFAADFSPRPVKAVRVTGRKLVKVENIMFSFSVSSLEVLDEAGDNAALVSRGAGVTVSGTYHSMGGEMEVQRSLIPIHYDLGLKCVRMGYHDDVLNWHWVEREKGVYTVDPYADRTVTELTDNGIAVTLCLNFGNRLYSGPETREAPMLWEWNYDPPRPPTTPEALEGWKGYVRFMARHFRDRVAVFEVWNEWNGGNYWGEKPDVEKYLAVLDAALPILRQEAPGVKLCLGGYSGFPVGIAGWSREELCRRMETDPLLRAVTHAASRVDQIGFHPFYNTSPLEQRSREYPEDLAAFRRFCRSQGFRGDFSVSEYNYGCCVPPYEGHMWWGDFTASELGKAKYIARLIANNTHQGVWSCFCESFSSTHPLDLSLFRRTVIQDPVDAQQPQAAYYVMRNLCSCLDGALPCQEDVALSGAGEPTHRCVLRRGGELLAAFWTIGEAEDNCPGTPVTLRAKGIYTRATGLDPVSGRRQPLTLSHENGETVLQGWLLTDYPVFVCLEGSV